MAFGACGFQVTVIVQVPFGATVEQLLVCVNAELLVPPVFVIDEIVRLALPVLVTVKFVDKTSPAECVPKLYDVGETLIPGTATPVPVRLAVWGLPVASSFTVSVPVRVPAAVGLKVTLIVQLAPLARDEPQLLVWA